MQRHTNTYTYRIWAAARLWWTEAQGAERIEVFGEDTPVTLLTSFMSPPSCLEPGNWSQHAILKDVSILKTQLKERGGSKRGGYQRCCERNRADGVFCQSLFRASDIKAEWHAAGMYKPCTATGHCKCSFWYCGWRTAYPLFIFMLGQPAAAQFQPFYFWSQAQW